MNATYKIFEDINLIVLFLKYSQTTDVNKNINPKIDSDSFLLLTTVRTLDFISVKERLSLTSHYVFFDILCFYLYTKSKLRRETSCMGTSVREIECWVKQNPYLKQIAHLQKVIVNVLDNTENSIEYFVHKEKILINMKKGIPVLKLDIINSVLKEDAANKFNQIVNALAEAEISPKITEYCHKLKDLFTKNTKMESRIIEQVIETNSSFFDELTLNEINEGFVLFLSWKALSSALEPLKTKVKNIQKDVVWTKPYCPVCGQLPAMGKLIFFKQGQKRELVCGCCQTHWIDTSIACPYCNNDTQGTIKLNDVTDFIIIYCEKCKCYLKTFTGNENEKVALADWSTLHLDLICKSWGLQRIGYRLYEI